MGDKADAKAARKAARAAMDAARPVKVAVTWTVSKDNITLSGTETSIIEAKQMAEWAERELYPLVAVGEDDAEDRIAPIGGAADQRLPAHDGGDGE